MFMLYASDFHVYRWMILEAEGSSSRHGFWGKIATKPTFFEMDIRIFIHHEI